MLHLIFWIVGVFTVAAALGFLVGLGVYWRDVRAWLRADAVRGFRAVCRSREAYCRVCREYRITADTICEHCSTPLLLFADALDMADHMGRTFPLPKLTPTLGLSQAKGFAVTFRDPTIFVDAARADRAAHLRLLQQRRRTH